jgi:hypothetical protein
VYFPGSQVRDSCTRQRRESVFRWFRDVVDHEVGHGLVHSFELEPKLFLHGGEDRGPAFWIVRGPVAAKLKRVIVGAGETGLVNDGRFYHRTKGAGDGPHWGIRSDEFEAMLRSLRLNIGRWGRGGRFAVRRPGRSLHLDAAFAHDEVIDGAIAGFEMCLEVQAFGQQHANRIPLFQPDLVIGQLGEPGVSRFVRAGLDVVERVRGPVRGAVDRGIEAVSNLEKGLDGKIRGFETAGVRRARDGYVETCVRRRCKADGGNVKGERGRVVGFLHDGGLRVKARAGQDDKNDHEPTDMSLNDAEHGREPLLG